MIRPKSQWDQKINYRYRLQTRSSPSWLLVGPINNVGVLHLFQNFVVRGHLFQKLANKVINVHRLESKLPRALNMEVCVVRFVGEGYGFPESCRVQSTELSERIARLPPQRRNVNVCISQTLLLYIIYVLVKAFVWVLKPAIYMPVALLAIDGNTNSLTCLVLCPWNPKKDKTNKLSTRVGFELITFHNRLWGPQRCDPSWKDTIACICEPQVATPAMYLVNIGASMSCPQMLQVSPWSHSKDHVLVTLRSSPSGLSVGKGLINFFFLVSFWVARIPWLRNSDSRRFAIDMLPVGAHKY